MDFNLCGGTQVMGFISPFDTNDTYAVVDPLYGIDGFRNVDDMTELNAIPNLRRRAGMVVGVSGGTSYYKLKDVVWSGVSSDWGTFFIGDTFVSGGSYSNNLLTINRNDGVDLTVSGFSATFTGNTSGDCITDIHVSNIHSCSPLQVNPLDEGNVYFGSSNGLSVILTGSTTKMGINVPSPGYALHMSGDLYIPEGSVGIGESPDSTQKVRITTSDTDGANTTALRVDMSYIGAQTGGVQSFVGGQFRSVPNKTNSGITQQWGVSSNLTSNVSATGTHMVVGGRFRANSTNADNYGIQIEDGTEEFGKVLVCQPTSLYGQVGLAHWGTVGVTGVTSDSFVINSLLSGNTLIFDRNDNTNAFNVDLSSLTTFTGNTSATCITDLYVSNMYGCSPITLHEGLQSTLGDVGNTRSIAWGDNVNISGRSQPQIGSIIVSGITIGLSDFYGVDVILFSGVDVADEWFGYIGATGVTVSLYGGSDPLETFLAIHTDFEGVNTSLSDFGATSPVGLTHTTLSANGITQLFIDDNAYGFGKDITLDADGSMAVGSDHTVTGNWSFTSGDGNVVTGDRSFTSGLGNTVSGDDSLTSGGNILVNGSNSYAFGDVITMISAPNSFSVGQWLVNTGNATYVGGQGTNVSKRVSGTGNASFIHSYTTKISIGVDGDYSAILTGQDHYLTNTSSWSAIIAGHGNVLTGTDRSVILGGLNITGTTSDTVYVPNLNINSGTTANTVTDLLVRDTDGTVSTRNISTLTLGSTTGGTYNELTTAIDFSGDSVDTTFSVSLSGMNATFGNTYFVAPEGNDDTGVRGNISQPFKTVSGGRNKAVSEISANTVTGSTLVYVYPGEYIDEEMQYDNGNFYFSPGAKVTSVERHGSGTTSMFVVGSAPTFTSASYSANTCNVFGSGEFILKESTDGGWGGRIIDIVQSGSGYFECYQMTVEQGIGVRVLDNGQATFRGVFIEIGDGYVSTVRDYGDAVFNFNRISVDTGGWPFLIRAGNTAGFYGKCIIDAEEISVGASALREAIYLQSLQEGAEVIINADKITSNGDYVITANANVGGDIIVNGKLFGLRALKTSNCTGGNITINGDGEFTEGGIDMLSTTSVGYNVTYDGHMTILSGATDGIDLDGGTLNLHGSLTNKDISGSGATYNGIDVTGTGVLEIDSFSIFTDNESIIGSNTVGINRTLYIDKPINVSTSTTGQYVFTGTTYNADLNIYNVPTNGNAATDKILSITSGGTVNTITGLTETLTFMTGSTGDVRTLTIENGLIISKTVAP